MYQDTEFIRPIGGVAPAPGQQQQQVACSSSSSNMGMGVYEDTEFFPTQVHGAQGGGAAGGGGGGMVYEDTDFVGLAPGSLCQPGAPAFSMYQDTVTLVAAGGEGGGGGGHPGG